VEHSTNEPVRIAGVDVTPGDLVLADGSGVVVVPADRAAEVLPEAEAIAAREAAIAAEIRAGRPISEAMSSSYESMLDRSKPV
jgi:regulator of RNase E activity RraA